MATLKDVAKLANCDVSTVSRALNNTSYVHPETRARIMEAVKELSYRPNVLAKGIRKGKLRTISVVVPRVTFSVYGELLEGIQEEARFQGYSVIICVTDNDPEIEREYLTKLRDSFTDGILVASTGKCSRLLRDIQASGTKVIQVIRKTEAKLSSVTADYGEGASMAVKYLYEKGCRRIALINAKHVEDPYKDRLAGYRKAMEKYGLEPIVSVSEHFNDRFGDGMRCFERLLDEYLDLDGVMVSLDYLGLGVLRVMRERGMSAPEDMRLISLTGNHIGEMLGTTMSAMEIPAFDMGKKAAHMLIEDIRSQTPLKQQNIVYKVSLTERESS